MSFQFASVEAFFAMGGHGIFVWLSYLITLLVLMWLIASPLMRSRQLRRALQRRAAGAKQPVSEEII